MDSQSYSNRLKQIRQKYNSTIRNSYITDAKNQDTYKPTPSRIPTSYHSQIRSRPYSQTSHTIKNSDQVRTYRKDDKSHNPEFQTHRKQYTDNQFSREEVDWVNQKYDNSIFMNSNKRQQRLQEIQQIRKSFADSRKKTIQDFTNQRLQKSNKRLQTRYQNTGGLRQGLRQRINTIADPIENTYSEKPILSLNYKKERFQPLQLNYDYSNSTQLHRYDDRQNSFQYQSYKDQSAILKSKIMQSPPKRSNYKAVDNYKTSYPRQTKQNLSKFDRQNINVATSIIKQFQGPSARYQISSSSPIKGLKGLQQIDKGRQRNWNPSNIDKIQERIQSVLGQR